MFLRSLHLSRQCHAKSLQLLLRIVQLLARKRVNPGPTPKRCHTVGRYADLETPFTVVGYLTNQSDEHVGIGRLHWRLGKVDIGQWKPFVKPGPFSHFFQLLAGFFLNPSNILNSISAIHGFLNTSGSVVFSGIPREKERLELTQTPQTPAVSRQPPRRRRTIWKWVIWSVVAVVMILIVGTGALSYYVASQLIHPARKPITATPAKYGLSYEPVTFTSSDHVKLSGWLIPAAQPTDKVVIEAHGYRQNRMLDKPALPMAKALHDAGYAVLMFDFRDEGQSGGNEVTVGLYEQRDLTAAVSYANQAGYSRVGLLGFSMGASTALEVAASDNHVTATVADSPFADLYQYLSVNMPTWTHLPNWPFTPEIFLELRFFNGVNVHSVSPARDLMHFGNRPLLLIAGTADVTVPMQNSIELWQELPSDSNVSLWKVPGATHVGAYTVEPQAYQRNVLNFYNKYL